MSLSLPTLQTFCVQALAKCFPDEGAPVYCTENAIHVFPTHLHLAHQIVLLGLFDIEEVISAFSLSPHPQQQR